MPRYLKANSLKITFREYWFLTRSLNVLIPWVSKLLRIRLPLVRGLAEPTSFRDLKVEEAELLPEVREKLRGPMTAFQQLGFRTPWFHKDKQSLIPAQGGAVVLLHESGEAVAKVISGFRVYAKKVPLKDGDYTMDHTALIYLMDRDGHFVSPFNLKRTPEEAATDLKRYL